MGAIMDLERLVECELLRLDWSLIREADGPATDVPVALRDLLSAKSPEEADDAYWRLENHVVVQGQLFEAAKFAVPILMAALVKADRPRHVRIGVLELLFQIVNGVPHEEEVVRGFADLGDRCKSEARDGLWLLYRESLEGEQNAAKEIIQLIDEDSARLRYLIEKLGI